MQESWPACGGSTSVGTTPRLAPGGEKSRRRAIGASNTTSFGEVHEGGRRVAIKSNHRGTSIGPEPPERAAPKSSDTPWKPIDQPSNQLFTKPEVIVAGPSPGGQCDEAFIRPPCDECEVATNAKSTGGNPHRCS